MNSKQNIVGKKAEVEVAQYFKSKRYWALIIPKSVNGQPFDIVAIRQNDVWLVDAKHLEKDKVSFPFDRIEPNQITSMNYARKYAGIEKNLGFIIYWEKDISSLFYLEYDKYLELVKKGEKSVKISELERMDLQYENKNI